MEITKPLLGTIVEINLTFRLPTSLEELLSTKDQMVLDLVNVIKM